MALVVSESKRVIWSTRDLTDSSSACVSTPSSINPLMASAKASTPMVHIKAEGCDARCLFTTTSPRHNSRRHNSPRHTECARHPTRPAAKKTATHVHDARPFTDDNDRLEGGPL